MGTGQSDPPTVGAVRQVEAAPSDAVAAQTSSTSESGEREAESANSLTWVAVHAAAVTACVLLLFYYWFAVADRYRVFLYNHMGATPFDAATSSRYWMAGLVAAGVVLVAYGAANWTSGRLARLLHTRYDPPHWRRVWLLSAAPTALGIVAITTRLNTPVLPEPLALACVVSGLAGLALALTVGAPAAHAPVRLLSLGLSAVGLWPALLLLHVLENETAGSMPRASVARAVAVALVAGTLWLAAAARFSARRGREPLGAAPLLAVGLAEAYLLLPLAHYLLFTPAEHRYISSAANFFASRWWVQAACLGLAAAQAGACAWLGRVRPRT